SLIFSLLNRHILLVRIVRVEVNDLSILIDLDVFNFFVKLLESKVFLLNILQQAEFIGFFSKLAIAEHSIFHKKANVIPFLLERLSIGFIELLQLFCYFPSDV